MTQPILYPSHDFYDARLFSLEDWPDLEEVGRQTAMKAQKKSRQQNEPTSAADRGAVIKSLNNAFSWAFSRAAFERDIPETRDQQRNLVSIRKRVTNLLALLDYDADGTPNPGPRDPIVQITPLMPWFQYLERAVPRAPYGAPGAGARWRFANIARRVVGDDPIRAEHARLREFHASIGVDPDGEDIAVSLDVWTIRQALEAVPHALALVTALAEAAQNDPITKDGKATFKLAFQRTLFTLLAGAYEQMFGEPPRPWLGGTTPGSQEGGKRPGPPALWAKRILTLAQERLTAETPQHGPLDPNGTNATHRIKVIRGTATWQDSTFATRMSKGWDEWKAIKKQRESLGIGT